MGHFSQTGTMLGNIGLAAHNRGYQKNYFEKLKELKKGDKIYYSYYCVHKRYQVSELLIIEDTNWEVLDSSLNSELTLITCMENRPHLRRCIKAIEI